MRLSLVVLGSLFCLGGLSAAPSSRALSNVERLKAQAEKEKWTFEVGYNSVMEYPMDQATGLIQPEDWAEGARFVSPRSLRLPAHFDWREESGGLPPIKNQKSCGSCWAFGTVAVLESILKIRDKRSVDLSEQQLVSCNRNGWSCNGGWFAHKYHVNPGATSNEEFPYAAKNLRCKPELNSAANIQSWAFVGTEKGKPSIAEIKNAILQFGPVATTVTANRAMMSYKGGVFNRCANSSINHLVNLVGWDDDGGYWIMRNSWGTEWGEEGYMRIKYGCSHIGDTASFVNYKATCTPQPLPYVGPNREIAAGETIFLGGMPIPGQTYQWSPAEGLDDATSARPLARPNRSLSYTLSVKNECGTSQQSVRVVVQ